MARLHGPIEALMRHRTAIVIGHCLSTLRTCHRLAMLDRRL
jgi:ABC-type multidrug transport system fused ATPase/permease subunit